MHHTDRKSNDPKLMHKRANSWCRNKRLRTRTQVGARAANFQWQYKISDDMISYSGLNVICMSNQKKRKVGIIICDRYHTCAGGKCFRALRNREGSFSIYKDQEVELVGYTSCGGC